MRSEGQRLRAVVVDDEPLARRRLRDLLSRDPEIDLASECEDGFQAVAAIEREKPDLLFLDVQMPEKDGFAVLREVGRAKMPVVVFVTAYDRYAIQAFEHHALDYLLKPFDEQRFRGALARAKTAARTGTDALLERVKQLVLALERRQDYLDRVAVKSAGRVLFFKTTEIDWMGAEGNYVRLHAGAASHLLRGTLGELERRLDPAHFRRIHRSTIVNLDRVKEIQPLFQGRYQVILHDGTKLPLGRGYRDRLESG